MDRNEITELQLRVLPAELITLVSALQLYEQVMTEAEDTDEAGRAVRLAAEVLQPRLAVSG